MITILSPDYLYTPEGYRRGLAVAFDETIRAVDTPEILGELFPEAQTVEPGERSILYPGFINVHVHLEFSANRTRLEYGDFMRWLGSVIRERDELVNAADDAVMEQACREMLRSGVTTFGAVSTFGADLEVCRRTPQRVTFFNEIVGSNPATIDALYADFLQRVDASRLDAERDRITPGVAIHAPHSVHPVAVRRAVALAREEGMPLSSHFLESPYEREWLEEGSGGFAEFFLNYLGATRPVTTVEEFLSHFDGYPSLFVHAVQTTEEERGRLAAAGHFVAHCPRSNRLLGCGRYPIEDRRVPVALATDGLSSNWSLNLFDEMRAALMLHHRAPVELLAQRLIRAVTLDAAHAIRSDAGRIEPGAPADFALVRLPQPCERSESLALHTLLHCEKAERVWIAGEELGLSDEVERS
jgi:cytosine/adenosine deaminase-related metal-dependent hydrolase